MSATRSSRRARLLVAVGVAASLTLTVAGCAPASAPSSVEVSADTIIVDVRTPAEFAEGHLEGAVNIDVQSAEFDALIADLDPDAEYLVYCRSGNRAATAIDRMAAQGFGSLANGGGVEQAAQITGLDIVG
ncbi:rhodanese-like domain-containing protein [Pseudolysinimonas yzui]|uniref:rhodanese-like domain-containing protein n=1 Tax=Pseudolysinimonas yzui TaxID=2708254 RepID=UPI001E3703E7|nr:rhodanese-like domain-containing protein [Pseudolysinimonas yzui]